ncbi:MAG: hypothetical protein FIB07_13150 [Candidatus Methanoperedens sp.]|nr:hypothetical protein [Candidatus Methanoperedens sp.]
MSITSVLLEVASIQQYVFGSNKLKENLGASYLVENIFKDNLKSAFEEGSINIDFDDWHEKPEKFQICDSNAEGEIGYIGGGNALLFFKENSTAKEIARLWSRDLLLKTPGLIPSIAIRDTNCSAITENFKSEMNELFNKLTNNKNQNQPQTMLPRHGITAECSHTGFSAECFNSNDSTYISSVAKSKIMNVENAKKEHKLRFKHILKDKFEFPDELNNLGQREGDNHISIVHIDGNGMGKRFRECNNLKELRCFSNDVHNATERSFGKLLEKIVEIYDDYYNDNFNLSYNMLPLRPIIIGGDDITFVSHGNLGIYFAKIFMEEFSKQPVYDNTKLSSCAGISITKTKYPFYRGYELAEDLCNHAKKKARIEEEKNTSWIDFHIAYGGFSGTLDEIRKKNYSASEGCLCLRPYRLEVGDHRSLDDCLNGIRQLKKQWPKSKLSEMREILEQGIPKCEMFIKEMEYRGNFLPEVKDHPECKKKGWGEDKGTKFTPYFDMLELMKFYPFDLDLGRIEK